MTDLERQPSFGSSMEAAPVQPEVQGEAEPTLAPQTSPQESTPMPSQAVLPPNTGGQFVVNDPRAGVLKRVEDVLSDGLQSLYFSLPEARRQAFKAHGERVAQTITDIILAGKTKVKEIWHLISEWLRTVPGVNKYFLEQEIKIKTDRIMMYAATARA